MMDNPYAMLEIKQTATDNEIRKALKRKIDLYCGSEGNYKNSDGEYLQQIFINAAKSLLDPEKRREIDENLIANQKLHGVISYEKSFEYSSFSTDNISYQNNYQESYQNISYDNFEVKEHYPEVANYTLSNVLALSKSGLNKIGNFFHNKVIPSIGKLKQHLLERSSNKSKEGNITVTYINNEFFNNLRLTLELYKKYRLERKLKLNNIYAVIGRDGSFMFAQEKPSISYPHCVTINNLFTGQKLLNDFFFTYNKPWINDGTLDIHNVESFVTAGSKFIPLDLIDHNGRISYSDLKELTKQLQDYFKDNQSAVDNLFAKSYVKHN